MKSTVKVWTGLGLATALVGTSLAGCSGEAGEGEGGESAIAGEAGEGGEGEGGEGESGEGEAGEGGEGEGGEGEGGEDAIGALPLPQRVAFMSGHVEAGLALYRAGDGSAAAPHLLHPVSETHAAERAGLDELGFDATPFETVSAALEAGQPAEEVEPQLAAAESNLDAVRSKAGGDPAELIRFLMDTTVEEYTIAVNDGVVTDPGEYQDAWGFVVVARDLAADVDTPQADPMRDDLETLLGLWPEAAPIPPEDPAPVGQVSALASRVLLALPQ